MGRANKTTANAMNSPLVKSTASVWWSVANALQATPETAKKVVTISMNVRRNRLTCVMKMQLVRTVRPDMNVSATPATAAMARTVGILMNV